MAQVSVASWKVRLFGKMMNVAKEHGLPMEFINNPHRRLSSKARPWKSVSVALSVQAATTTHLHESGGENKENFLAILEKSLQALLESIIRNEYKVRMASKRVLPWISQQLGVLQPPSATAT